MGVLFPLKIDLGSILNYNYGMKVNCKTCKKEFNAEPNKIKIGGGIYCSQPCACIGKINKRGKIPCAICGKELRVTQSRLQRQERFYCSKECRLEGFRRWDTKRVNNYREKNRGIDKMALGKKGFTISTDGYYVYDRTKIHRYIMEQHIGRKLLPTEIVHHINENKFDNRIENLQIVSRSEHNKIHKFLHKRGLR